MRVKNSLINVSVGIGSQLIITILSFISRTVFIDNLGINYLGINGLFTNILSMLSLAEAGIGASIIYSLYKPVAENNEGKILALMRLYKRAYMIIGLVVFLIGVALLPFLKYFTKDSGVSHLYLIYIIFLLNTCASYFFAHKISFLNVCQKGYIVTSIYSISSILTGVVRITILVLTKNYILYLVIDFLIIISTSYVLGIVVNRIYPFLKKKISSPLDKETKQSIIKNVKALVLHNIGGYVVFGTDNLLISSFVSIAAVGLYSNYYMIINIVRTFISQVFNNITYSVGNLVAEETKDKIYQIFKVTLLCNFWIYSFCIIGMFILLEPLISLWLGSKFLLGKSVLMVLLANLYISGMRRSIATVKTTAGIFHEDRYAPFIEAVINLGLSIILVKHFGIAGVFLGTFISTILVPFWIAPYLVYKKTFEKPVVFYFIRYSVLAVIGCIALFLTDSISHFASFTHNPYVNFLLKACVCLIIPNVVYTIAFYKTSEFKYLLQIVKNLLGQILSRFKMKESVSG